MAFQIPLFSKPDPGPRLVEGDPPFLLVRRPRRRGWSLKVLPDGQVRLTGPRGLGPAEARRVVDGQRAWIRRRLLHYQDLRERFPPRRWESGGRLHLLGQDLVLETEEMPGRGGVEQRGEFLHVRLPPGLSPLDRGTWIQARLAAWCRARAAEALAQRVALFSARMGLKPKGLRVKDTRSLWGSSSRSGNLNFNWRLAMAPAAVMDYVVVHELCHLVRHDHSPAFWALVEKEMPDYKQHRTWLRKNGEGLYL